MLSSKGVNIKALLILGKNRTRCEGKEDNEWRVLPTRKITLEKYAWDKVQGLLWKSVWALPQEKQSIRSVNVLVRGFIFVMQSFPCSISSYPWVLESFNVLIQSYCFTSEQVEEKWWEGTLHNTKGPASMSLDSLSMAMSHASGWVQRHSQDWMSEGVSTGL